MKRRRQGYNAAMAYRRQRANRAAYAIPMPIDDGYVLEPLFYEGRPCAIPVPNRYREIRCRHNMQEPLTMEEIAFANDVINQMTLILQGNKYCKCSLCKL